MDHAVLLGSYRSHTLATEGNYKLTEAARTSYAHTMISYDSAHRK